MDVTRITTKHGSHISPPLDPRWEPLKQLEWKASCVSVDSGIKVSVTQGSRTSISTGEPVWDAFNIQSGKWAMGIIGFDRAWDVLIGIELGAKAAQEKALKDLCAEHEPCSTCSFSPTLCAKHHPEGH